MKYKVLRNPHNFHYKENFNAHIAGIFQDNLLTVEVLREIIKTINGFESDYSSLITHFLNDLQSKKNKNVTEEDYLRTGFLAGAFIASTHFLIALEEASKLGLLNETGGNDD